MTTPKRQAATAIYEQIMLWLEGRLSGDAKTGHLVIPIVTPADEQPRELRFRRQTLMGGVARAQSMSDESVIIPYDPAWESLAKIERLMDPPTK